MKSTLRTQMIVACCCLLVILVAAGCAALSSTAVKQETLEERVNHYMQAQLEGKWDQAYSFLDSSSREKTSKDLYVQQHDRKLSYKKFEIEGITLIPSVIRPRQGP